MAKKNDIKFVDTSKEVKNTLVNLSKSALRASAKPVRKVLRNNVPVRLKRLRNHIASWAFVDYLTGLPQLQIGFYSASKVRKRGKQPSHANPHWVEYGVRPHVIEAKNVKAMGYGSNFFGSSAQHPGHRGTNVLRNSVYDNIDVIKAAQIEYLSSLTGDIEMAAAKIIAGEEVEDD